MQRGYRRLRLRRRVRRRVRVRVRVRVRDMHLWTRRVDLKVLHRSIVHLLVHRVAVGVVRLDADVTVELQTPEENEDTSEE